MTRTHIAIAMIAAVGLAGIAWAQKADTMDHSKMDHSKMGMPMPADAAASSKAYKETMEKMHNDMTMSYTGDSDKDFVTGMVPHHQGAVEMAKIELQYGKDPELKKLATNIIKSQDEEIAFMKTWLAKNAK